MTDFHAELDAEILNDGLALAMEFGKDWLQPIQSRLAKRHPQLTTAELDTYDDACGAAMRFGHERVPAVWPGRAGSEREAFRRFRDDVLARHPWVSADNLSRLFSQGCYYASK